jgi:hypothetical protein
VIIGIVLSGIKLVHDVPYTGSRGVDVVGAIHSAWAASCSGSSSGRRAAARLPDPKPSAAAESVLGG